LVSVPFDAIKQRQRGTRTVDEFDRDSYRDPIICWNACRGTLLEEIATTRPAPRSIVSESSRGEHHDEKNHYNESASQNARKFAANESLRA
jgi:hypothetical protein